MPRVACYASGMIVDTLERMDRYGPCLPGLAALLAWVRGRDVETLATGRFELTAMESEGTKQGAKPGAEAGAGAAAGYVVVDRYTTRDPDEAIWESHERYVDVQIMIAGGERVGVVGSGSAGAVVKPYDREKDAAFYETPGDPSRVVWIDAAPGDVMIFWPSDVHSPSRHPGGLEDSGGAVTKVIGKLAVLTG